MDYLYINFFNQLWKFSGEDYTIIAKCNGTIKLYFSLIGLFVFFILINCFLSALYFTENVFHNLFADIGIGLIWGYIVTNLYVLLLYTITPALLPLKERKKSKTKISPINLNFSMVIRILLVMVLGVITAQPINIFFFKPNTETFAFDIRDLLTTSYYAWLLTVLVVGIFLLPIYLKYSIRKFGEFYERKAEIKKQIILDNYVEFKVKYSYVLECNISRYNSNLINNLKPYLDSLQRANSNSYLKFLTELEIEVRPSKISKFEYWANPPFRTIHCSKDKILLSEETLLNYIY